MKRILTMVFALMLCIGVVVPSVGADTDDYDYTSEIASWKKVATLPTADAQMVASVKDKIYVMGIKTAGGVYTDKMDIFDLKTKKWSSGRDMIDVISRIAAIATVDDKLYVMGGMGINPDNGRYIVQIYDPKTNAWSPGTRMPVRLSGAACAAVGDNIYVFGGFKHNDSYQTPGELSGYTYIYNTKTDTWRAEETSPKGKDVKACVVGKKIYIFSCNVPTNSMFVYNTETDTFDKGESVPYTKALKTAVSIGENIYTISAFGNNTSKRIDIYNTTTKTWSVNTKAWPRGAALPENVGEPYNLFQALGINGTIYAMDKKNILSIETEPPAERSQLSIGLNVGQSIQLNGMGNLAGNTDLTWTSSDSVVASVDNSGKVTALKKGLASISASNADGTAEQSLAIEVTEPEPAKTVPVVTGVRWTESGAVVTAKGEKEITMYGISTTTSSNAANWKRSNVFNSVKIGTTYYFFAKDEDGNISEPFEFKRVE